DPGDKGPDGDKGPTGDPGSVDLDDIPGLDEALDERILGDGLIGIAVDPIETPPNGWLVVRTE
ncbi:MAG TPA: hypothetical protein PKD68_00030, partial [Candidatus Saccharibacteria bacterium]|nr:hypothetical protein [Candidatus Saccharibacteria bacterium]